MGVWEEPSKAPGKAVSAGAEARMMFCYTQNPSVGVAVTLEGIGLDVALAPEGTRIWDSGNQDLFSLACTRIDLCGRETEEKLSWILTTDLPDEPDAFQKDFTIYSRFNDHPLRIIV